MATKKNPDGTIIGENATGNRVETLKDLLFSDVKRKNDKIQLINQTGNFDIAKENPPWFIILPNGQFRKTWDAISFMSNMYIIIIMPIDIAWNTECFAANVYIFTALYHTMFFIMVMELLLNMITAILDEKNNYIYNFEIIITSYAKGGLLLDILCAFPWHMVKPFNYSDCFMPYIAGSKQYYFLFFFCNFF